MNQFEEQIVVDFKAELTKQMRFVIGSAKLFDDGNPEEGIRIANCLEIIFNDKARYKILPDWIKQHSLQIVSTCTKGLANNNIPFTSLVQMVLSPSVGNISFRPALNDSESKLVSLNTWWNEEAIFKVDDTTITRSDLVLWARNTDGGAHIQKKHRAYRWLMEGAGWSITNKKAGGKSETFAARSLHLSSLRQLAFELSSSPSIQALWHPNWSPTHSMVTKPQDDNIKSVSWELMVYDGFAYTKEQWDSFSKPMLKLDSEMKFQMMPSAQKSFPAGTIEIRRINAVDKVSA